MVIQVIKNFLYIFEDGSENFMILKKCYEKNKESVSEDDKVVFIVISKGYCKIKEKEKEKQIQELNKRFNSSKNLEQKEIVEKNKISKLEENKIKEKEIVYCFEIGKIK